MSELCTNLLGRKVIFGYSDSIGYIVCVYLDHNKDVQLIVANSDGLLHNCNISGIRMCSEFDNE